MVSMEMISIVALHFPYIMSCGMALVSTSFFVHLKFNIFDFQLLENRLMSRNVKKCI